MSGRCGASSRRELALVGCALLLPIPLLAVGAYVAPLLPSVVERSVASLRPSATGTVASASGGTTATPGSRGAEGDAATSLEVTSPDLEVPTATDTAGTAEGPASDGTRDDSGEGSSPSGAGTAPSGEDAPPSDAPAPGEATHSSSTSQPQAQEREAQSSGGAPALRVPGGGQGSSLEVSADPDGAGVSSWSAGGGSEAPGGSLGVTSLDGSTTEASTEDVSAPGLPVP